MESLIFSYSCFLLRCPLVPVFTFGEIDVFDQINNPLSSRIRNIQNLFKKYVGFPQPFIVFGRGLFQYSFGILPHRKRIVQVGM